ncbi:hypothetical protein KGD82_22240 [Nocardiopsis eucommiae]|uniref:Uncharacterized protein n=1 Tax=Nocardiopsis eucommiae TaxID=2831970 RepID=A0A975L9A9_9ACTN|nr:hypothetical protein KGD82_22240 [Nocardiopsis eucommiae]
MLPVQGTRLARITRILVTNSHQHSRSGLPGGTVRVVLDQSRPLLPTSTSRIRDRETPSGPSTRS